MIDALSVGSPRVGDVGPKGREIVEPVIRKRPSIQMEDSMSLAKAKVKRLEKAVVEAQRCAEQDATKAVSDWKQRKRPAGQSCQ